MTVLKLPKPRNPNLNKVLIAKTNGGAAGKHVTLKSKEGVKKQLSELFRKRYFE